jgi:hypothetical protein
MRSATIANRPFSKLTSVMALCRNPGKQGIGISPAPAPRFAIHAAGSADLGVSALPTYERNGSSTTSPSVNFSLAIVISNGDSIWGASCGHSCAKPRWKTRAEIAGCVDEKWSFVTVWTVGVALWTIYLLRAEPRHRAEVGADLFGATRSQVSRTSKRNEA